MDKAYQKLSTEFYDLTKPVAGPKEIAFYAESLRNRKGPFLEAMCGSGRLLIPLLAQGFAIDGVDNSSPMLTSCAERCAAKNLKVNLHNQSIVDLSLPTQYDVIFIVEGSIQLIERRSDVLLALKKLYDHLLPGGLLILETFVLWEAIKDCVAGTHLLDHAEISFEKKVRSPEGDISHKGTITTYPKEQFQLFESTYKKMIGQKTVAKEAERLALRWYYRYEMQHLLEQSGFSKITIQDQQFELNPQAFVYRAIKSTL